MRRVPFSSIVLAVLLACALMLRPLDAQPRALAGTTLTTTDTSANSVLVGCAVGSTTCTGGIKAGPLVATTGTFSGPLVATTGTFSGAVSIANNVALTTFNSAAVSVPLAKIDGSNNYTFGSGNAAQVNNTILSAGAAIDLQTGGVSRANFDGAGAFNLLYGLSLSNAISPAALGAGSNNDYNPTGLASAFVLRLTPNGGGSTLTGVAAQAAGSLKVLCNIGGGTLTVGLDSASSSAANRITGTSLGDRVMSAGGCLIVWYDGTSSRWRLLAEIDS